MTTGEIIYRPYNALFLGKIYISVFSVPSVVYICLIFVIIVGAILMQLPWYQYTANRQYRRILIY